MDRWWADKIQKYYVVQDPSKEYTTLSIPANYEGDSQIDIRVQANFAIIYYTHEHLQPVLGFEESIVTSSDFNTQTLTIHQDALASEPAPTPILTTPTPTSTASAANSTPNSPLIEPTNVLVAVVVVLIAIIAILAIFYGKARSALHKV
jgi:hypothetical protein